LAILLFQVIQLLFKNDLDCTALHIAAAREQYEICNKLIDLGVDINAKDLHGNTAAHHAALVGSLEISQLLHSAKANLSVRNKKAMIPMHSCIISDDVQTFQFLVERSEGSLQHSRTESVRNLKTYNGFTPIMVAIEKDSLNIFNYLIRTSANLNIQDDKGKTPLHLALQLKKENIAKLLIKAKALINIGDFNNETPVMYAVKNGLIDSLRLLHKTGANLFQINTRGETLLHMSARVDRADMIGKTSN
jgi:ankyrin repeat protein